MVLNAWVYAVWTGMAVASEPGSVPQCNADPSLWPPPKSTKLEEPLIENVRVFIVKGDFAGSFGTVIANSDNIEPLVCKRPASCAFVIHDLLPPSADPFFIIPLPLDYLNILYPANDPKNRNDRAEVLGKNPFLEWKVEGDIPIPASDGIPDRTEDGIRCFVDLINFRYSVSILRDDTIIAATMALAQLRMERLHWKTKEWDKDFIKVRD